MVLVSVTRNLVPKAEKNVIGGVILAKKKRRRGQRRKSIREKSGRRGGRGEEKLLWFGKSRVYGLLTTLVRIRSS